jgi:protein AaeX
MTAAAAVNGAPGSCAGGRRRPILPALHWRSIRMRFAEIDLFGVYVAPISVFMVAAWFVTIGMRWLAARFGLLRHVWHPALFVFSIYVIVLSSIVLWAAR